MEKDRLVYDRSIAIHRLETTVRFRNNAVPCERAPGSEPADEELGVRDAEMGADLGGADKLKVEPDGCSPPTSECSSLFHQLRQLPPLSDTASDDVRSGDTPAEERADDTLLSGLGASAQHAGTSDEPTAFLLRPLRPPSPLVDEELPPLHPPPNYFPTHSDGTTPTASATFYNSTARDRLPAVPPPKRSACCNGRAAAHAPAASTTPPADAPSASACVSSAVSVRHAAPSSSLPAIPEKGTSPIQPPTRLSQQTPHQYL